MQIFKKLFMARARVCVCVCVCVYEIIFFLQLFLHRNL